METDPRRYVDPKGLVANVPLELVLTYRMYNAEFKAIACHSVLQWSLHAEPFHTLSSTRDRRRPRWHRVPQAYPHR